MTNRPLTLDRRRMLMLVPALAVAGMLSACGSLANLGERGPEPIFYDLGDPRPLPGEGGAVPAAGAVPVALADVAATGASTGNDVIYRFDGADAWQPRAYARARWSQPPGDLLRLRAQQRLAATRPVILASEVTGGATLQLSLEDFSQHFQTPTASRGVVRVRATLMRNGAVLAQRAFQASEEASSADANGGVQALVRASDLVLDELAAWTDATLAR